MTRRWSEQLGQRYRMELPPDLADWFDSSLWQQQAGGEFHCPLEPEKLLDPPAGLIWTGFLPPDMLPLVSNDYGDLLCLRVGRGNSIREIVAWRHGGGDWIPYGNTLAEALLYDAVIGSPYSQQEQFVDREAVEPTERYTFANWAVKHIPPPGESWPNEWSSDRWPALLAEAGYAADCLSRDTCLRLLHTPLRENRSVPVSRQLELRWSPDFISYQFDADRTPADLRPTLADKLDVPVAELLDQDWTAAAAEAKRVAERRSDLGWAFDTLGWQCEREGNPAAALAYYWQGLHCSQFADQAIDFRTHWFDEAFGKFSAWRLYELRDHLTPEQRAGHYLQIFHAADELLLRQRVGEFWIESAEIAERKQDWRTAYDCYQRAGWDLGLLQLTGYQQVLEGLIRSATATNDAALVEVAKVHLAAI